MKKNDLVGFGGSGVMKVDAEVELREHLQRLRIGSALCIKIA